MCVDIKYPEFDPDIRLYVSKLCWARAGDESPLLEARLQ